MKLRNKTTGEIIETDYMFGVSVPTTETFGCKSYDQIASYNSLAELNEEWEDYEEPKPSHYFYIESAYKGGIDKSKIFDCEDCKKIDEFNKSIGNYFETEEEAEKAVEKLKAWKRLKDKGFRFERWLLGGEYGNTITFSDYIEYNDETRADLDLLFGSEE